jgi:nitrite reductase (NADH) large subunit
MATNYVIIGASVAGTAAAAAIRDRDPDGRIILVGEEEFGLYSRIRLPEYLAGRLERERLVIRKSDWYQGLNIDLRTSTRAESVDLKGASVSLSGGETLSYDRLLLATGADCFVPPFAGHDLPGVFTVRTVQDVDRLRARAEGAREVVVIGGGLLGLEMASVLIQLGLAVTVVEVLPWLLPRQLDRPGGELLQSILEKNGLKIKTDTSVEAIVGKDGVSAVRLSEGEIPASLVLVSAGIRPRVDLAKSAGLRVEKGIVIGDQGNTTAEGVYAAGDCAEHRGRIHGIWPAAEAQGRVAGTVMAGGEAVYSGTPDEHRLKFTAADGSTVSALLKGDPSDRRKVLEAIDDGSRHGASS